MALERRPNPRVKCRRALKALAVRRAVDSFNPGLW